MNIDLNMWNSKEGNLLTKLSRYYHMEISTKHIGMVLSAHKVYLYTTRHLIDMKSKREKLLTRVMQKDNGTLS